MTSDALGKRLLRALLDVQDTRILNEKGISHEDVYEDARHAWKWVDQYLIDKGEWPTPRIVEEQTGCTFAEEADGLEYIAEVIRKRKVGVTLERALKSAIGCIERREPDEAVQIVLDAALSARKEVTAGKIISFKKSGEERYHSYVDSKEKGGLIGLPTPWPALNSLFQGWVNGSLNVVVAMSNTGKTWVSVICAEFAERRLREEGKNQPVLLVTLEMSAARMARRLDAIRYKIPFGRIRDSDIDEYTEKEWSHKLTEAGKDDSLNDILIADKKIVRTVNDVTTLVRQHKPALVIIDGAYRFESDQFGSWEKTVDIVNSLQRVSEKTDIPWLATTQMGSGGSEDSSKVKKKGPKVIGWNVRYGKEWFINPDVVLGMYQDDDLRLVRQMELHPLKVREADKMFEALKITWDMTEMNFTQVDGATVPPYGSTAVPVTTPTTTPIYMTPIERSEHLSEGTEDEVTY